MTVKWAFQRSTNNNIIFISYSAIIQVIDVCYIRGQITICCERRKVLDEETRAIE